MYLFSYESPSLELNFCYLSHNFSCVYFPGKSSSPILEVSCILPKVLSLSPESAIALCLRQVPVTPTQPPGCPGHQGNILTCVCAQSCSGHCGAFYKDPLPALLSDSQPWDCPWPREGRSPHSEAAATGQRDASPLRRRSL
jgi:hypothetical protein